METAMTSPTASSQAGGEHLSEHYYADISIGGRVTREQWEQMLCCEEALAAFNPVTGEPQEGDTRDSREGPLLTDDGSLYFGDGQATNGEFDDLERYLVEQSIPFDRHSSLYDYTAEDRSFRPGVGDVRAFVDDGAILCDAGEVVRYIEAGMTLDQILALGEGGDTGIRLYTMRKDHPLPPFEFAEE